MNSNPSLAIIDYELGNLFSVQKAALSVGFKSFLTNNETKVRNADCIIIPGVGSYKSAMNFLKQRNLDEAIREKAKTGTPIMGICLGMQLLFSESVEFGITKGLSLIDGKVYKFDNKNGFKIPHIGWNAIYEPRENLWQNSILKNSNKPNLVYFVHSYYCKPNDEKHILSTSRYITDFCSTVIFNNIYGTQWHPEKSGENGLKVYQNWRDIIYKL